MQRKSTFSKLVLFNFNKIRTFAPVDEVAASVAAIGLGLDSATFPALRKPPITFFTASMSIPFLEEIATFAEEETKGSEASSFATESRLNPS